MADSRPATELWVTRHGETVWNNLRKYQGHLHGELSMHGRRQAEALATRLASEGFAALYSSDLQRASRTAECIAAKSRHPIQRDGRLRERNLGIFQGLNSQQIQQQYPDDYEKYMSNDENYVIPEGESRRQRYDRVTQCTREIVEQHVGQRVVIVTHGGPLSDLFCYTLQIPLDEPRRFKLYNAGLNVFLISNGQWRLGTWGDISHLRETDGMEDW
jgi:probable phosphoglycerate mutase